MSEQLRILIVEDSEDDAILIEKQLKKSGSSFIFARVETENEMRKALRDNEWDIIISDYSLPKFSGPAALKTVKEFDENIPFIIISRAIGEETAVEAMKAGAHDYIMKDNLHRLIPAIQREIKEAKDRKRLLKDKAILENQLRNAVQDGMVVINSEGCIEDINVAAMTFFDTSYENAKSSSINNLCNKWMQDIPVWIHQCLHSQKPIHNSQIESTTGSFDRIYKISITPLVTSQEVQVLLLIQDISQLHTLEQNASQKERFGRIIGKSKPMIRIFEMIKALSNTDTTVLIHGPSGTGKELICEAIHENSSRKDKPFVKINCAALPENLLESELFGHVKGAFTNAHKDKIGKFELANGGTIFLDEIGDISHALQLRLLRILQERELERVGSNKTIKIDVRVVAATNKNLLELIQQNAFREDLYYRLNVMAIDLPPLSQRHGDIPLLIRHFLQLSYARLKKTVKAIEPEAMKVLLQYDWPGNIRQLENALERAVILCRDGVIQISDLPAEVTTPQIVTPRIIDSVHNPTSSTTSVPCSVEKDLLLQTLTSVGWNRSKAAKKLGVHRNTISRWIKLYHLVK